MIRSLPSYLDGSAKGMLVLTRAVGDSFRIGEVVEVKILGMKGGQVRVGIDAPEAVKILRSEIIDQREERDRASRD